MPAPGSQGAALEGRPLIDKKTSVVSATSKQWEAGVAASPPGDNHRGNTDYLERQRDFMCMNEQIALVCPGMGQLDQASIMRQLLITPMGRTVLQEATAVLAQNPCDQWRSDDANYSPAAQTCFFLSCLALALQMRAELDVDPALIVGPSFGVRVATVAAGALSLEDGIKLTAGMTTVMEDWFTASQDDLVTQSFARLAEEPREKLLEELHSEGYYAEVSCLADHDLVLITVDEVALNELINRGREAGAMPLYTMKPPMHASRLSGLRDEIAERVLPELEFRDPLIPIVSDIDGSLITTGKSVHALLLQSIDHMVNWLKVCDALEQQSIDQLWVAGQDGLFTRAPVTSRRWPVRQISAGQAISPAVRPPRTI